MSKCAAPGFPAAKTRLLASVHVAVTLPPPPTVPPRMSTNAPWPSGTKPPQTPAGIAAPPSMTETPSDWLDVNDVDAVTCVFDVDPPVDVQDFPAGHGVT